MQIQVRKYALGSRTMASWIKWQHCIGFNKILIALVAIRLQLHSVNLNIIHKVHAERSFWLEKICCARNMTDGKLMKAKHIIYSFLAAGHGSGAACIHFLMTSPTMVPGLFHRVILLSGSAFSSWALVEDPVIYALKLAKEVNCTIPEDLIKNHEHIVDCLREVPLEELFATEIQAPSFLTAFGPSVSLKLHQTILIRFDKNTYLLGGLYLCVG